MNRIMVIGPCGAGKSTLARKLHVITELPLIHLDKEYWRPGWIETPQEEWIPRAKDLAARPKWIIDGNYGSSMDIRLERADMVVFLDRSTRVCFSRAMKRIIRGYGRTRADMHEGCPERFDLEFIHYILTFRMTRRPGIIKRMSTLRPDQELITLKSDKDQREFIQSMEVRFGKKMQAQ